RGHLRKVASARGNVDLRSASIAVSRNFPNSESMAEQSPPTQAASTFRSIAAVGSWSVRSPSAALLLDRQPAFQRCAQLLDAYRLHQIGIHAGCEAALFL